MTKTTEKKDLTASLKELEEIVQWFDEQEEVDVEKGLAKVKYGAALIKSTKKQLKEVENEFEEVQKDLSSDMSN